MRKTIVLTFLSMTMALGCRGKGMREPISNSLEPVQASPAASTDSSRAPINLPATCKAGEVVDNGKCVVPPAKCQATEAYLAHLDKCVPATAENLCFSKGQVLVDGKCTNNAYYATCILKTGRSAPQDAILAKLKLVAADETCEGSYAKLAPLTSLDLSDGDVDLDLRVLGDFLNLEELDVEKNKIVSAAGLEKLLSLEKLNLSNNDITSIAALSELTKLEDLDVGDNKIRDIAPLRKLTRLEDLDIGENDVTSLTALTGMTKLRKLDAHDNGSLRDLRPLRTLSDLESINIEDTEVRDLSPLRDLFLLELKITGSDIAGFVPSQVSETTCPVDSAVSAVLVDVCTLLRGL